MPRHSHLRDDRDQADHSVSSPELFFDLVFVFAVTQLSHYLLAHHTSVGSAADAGHVHGRLVGLDAPAWADHHSLTPPLRRSASH